MAIAGSVTSVFLGIWSILFSWVTALAAINALIGLCFAFWGFQSRRSRLAVVGTVLCGTGGFLSLFFLFRGTG